MLVFLRVAMAVAATVSSLFSIWQAAEMLQYQPYERLTLPAYDNVQQLLDVVLIWPAKSLLGFDTENATTAFGHASKDNESVIVGDNLPVASATNHSFLPTDLPENSSAQTLPIVKAPLWESVKPISDGEVSSFGQAVLATLASFNSLVDYLFSFVEESPNSVLGALQFGLVAFLILGFVLTAGTTLTWSLHFVDLRGQTSPQATNLLPNGTEVAVSPSQGEDNDVVSFLSNLVPPYPQNKPLPDENMSFVNEQAMEILAFATDFAKAYSLTAGESARAEIREFVEDNISKIGGVTKRLDSFEHSIGSQFKDIAQGKKTDMAELKKEFQLMLQNKLDPWTIQIDSKIESTFSSKFETRLGEITAAAQNTAKTEIKTGIKNLRNDNVKALSNMEASISSNDVKVADALRAFKDMKDEFENVKEQSTKQGTDIVRLVARLEDNQRAHDAQINVLKTEVTKAGRAFKDMKSELEKAKEHSNKQRTDIGRLATKLEENQKAHEAQISKVNAEAKVHVSKAVEDVKKLERASFAKADSGACKDLEQKITDVEASFRTNLWKLETRLNMTTMESDSKTLAVEVQLVKQQEALKKLETNVKSDVEACKLVENLANSEVDTDVTKAHSELEVITNQLPTKVVARDAETATKIGQSDSRAVNEQIDLKAEIVSEKGSNLHDLKVKIDPVAAAKGAAAMMASRYAPLQRRPVVSVTDLPRRSGEVGSGLHEPKVRFDPAAAAKGASAMMESRYARPERQPLANLTNLPRPTVEEASKAVPPPDSVPTDTTSSTNRNETPSEVSGDDTVTVPIPHSEQSPSSPASPANDQTPSSPSEPKPKGPKYPPGNGPGPNGGQKVLTDKVRERNKRRAIVCEISKVLKPYTEAERAHARQYQDPVTLHFAEGSPWEWMNPLIKRRARAHDVWPPNGWTPPLV